MMKEDILSVLMFAVFSLYTCQDADTGNLSTAIDAWPQSFTSIAIEWTPPKLEIWGYRIFYTTNINLPTSMWSMQQVGNNPLTTIRDLTPRTVYAISIQAITINGLEPHSKPIQVKTQRGLPNQPSSIKASKISSTSMELQWEKPTHLLEKVIGYELYWNETFTNGPQLISLNITYAYKLTDLYPGTVYTIWVAAKSRGGEGAPTPPLEVLTKPEAPCRPRKVKATAINRTAIMMTWERPCKRISSGYIAGYYLRVRGSDSKDSMYSRKEHYIADEDAEMYNITDLQPDTEYEIRVVADTRKLDPPVSKVAKAKTSGGVPTKPDLKVKWSLDEYPFVVELTWDSPVHTYGHLRSYRLIYGRWDALEKQQMAVQDLDPRAERQTFHNLDHGAQYLFYLSGRNDLGWGQEAVVDINTPEAVPTAAPQNLTYDLQSPSTVVVSWLPPPLIHRNGNIILYGVQFHRVSKKIISENNTSEMRMVFSDLEEDTDYVFAVRAYTAEGAGPKSNRVFVTTLRYVAPEPVDIRVFATSTESVEVQWSWDPSPYLFEALGFEVMYSTRPSKDLDLWGKKRVPFTSSAEITGLQHFSTYFIMLAVVTKDGLGRLSQVSKVNVSPTDVPTELRADNITSDSVLLSWKRPMNFFPFKYEISYRAQKEYYNGQGIYQQLTLPTGASYSHFNSSHLHHLMPFTTYLINVSAVAPDGLYRPPAKITVTTSMAAPSALSKPSVVDHGWEIAIILTAASEEFGPISRYFVIVVPENYATIDPQEFSTAELSVESKDSLRPYIAAKFLHESAPMIFPLGDGKTYKGNVNRKLPLGVEYKVFVRVCVDSHTKKLCTSSPYSDSFRLLSLQNSPPTITRRNSASKVQQFWIMWPVILALRFIF